jgi:vacuolar protein sorting-associated protein 41
VKSYEDDPWITRFISFRYFPLQGTTQHPEIHLVSWKKDELTTDALPIHGYEHYKEKDYALAYAPF